MCSVPANFESKTCLTILKLHFLVDVLVPRGTESCHHLLPFLCTHLFPCLNTIFKNGSFLSVVALVSVTLLDSNPRPSAEKSNLATTDN